MNNPAERNEISLHEVRTYLVFLGRPTEWLTNREISKLAQISERTARAHTLKLVRLGILDQAEVFPAHRFHISDKGSKRNVAYSQRLAKAAEVFGLGGQPVRLEAAVA